MKIYKVILLLLLGITYVACERREVRMDPEDASGINGQLCYMPNPFSPETDTILCLNNAYIVFCGYNYEYCSYVRNLLSQNGGRFIKECMFHTNNNHNWHYLAGSKQFFYPVCKKQFVSLIDSNTGMIADSIILNDRTIYPKRKRNGDSDHVIRFYLEDFVWFQGSDDMKPKFITDSITSFCDTIVCFDGHRGPFGGDSSLTNSNPYIFNE